MLREYICDLHIHTCLSPCAELDLYPRAIVRKALSMGIDIIAICDHNSSENVFSVMKAAEQTPLSVLPGMEVTTQEEVHTIAIFDNRESLSQLQEIVYGSLPGNNVEEIFGCQAIVNELDEVEGFNEHLLIGATEISLNDLVSEIHCLDGLAIAAHIDRESFGVIGQLGFLPLDVTFDALEISSRTSPADMLRRCPDLESAALIRSSDAHFTRDIGNVTTSLIIQKPTVPEILMAFEAREGRRISG